MCNLSKAFGKEKSLIAYLTCGDPSVEATKQAALTAVEAGADMIALGIPFSDPTAVDPVIQASNIRALAKGTTPEDVFKLANELSDKVPVILLTYANVVCSLKPDSFAKKCQDSGVSGVVIHDVPFEERQEFAPIFEECGVCVISTLSPSVPDRIPMIAKAAKGFVYVITDAKTTTEELQQAVEIIRLNTDAACVVGCGVADSAPIEDFCQYADGAMLDYELVSIMEKNTQDTAGELRQYVSRIDELLNR